VPRDGAEAEWVGETHDSLTVRHEDPAVAKTVKQMLVERYPNRTALLASIGETRGPGGFAVQYRDGHPVLPADRIWRMDLEVDNTDADDFSDLVGVTGNVVVYGTFTAPLLDKTGNVVVYGTFTAPLLAKTGNVVVDHDGTFTAPVLDKTGNVAVYGTFTAPLLAKTGNVHVHVGGTFTAPVLAKTGNVVVDRETGKLEF